MSRLVILSARLTGAVALRESPGTSGKGKRVSTGTEAVIVAIDVLALM
jgi:hypothetical protein